MKNVKEAAKTLKLYPKLRLGEKLPGGGVKANGPHTVKITAEPTTTMINKNGKMVKAFKFTVEENGQLYKWLVPLLNEEGEEVKVKVPQDSLAFLFLGKTLVFYHNPKRLDTFGKLRVSVKKISWQTPRGQTIEFKGDTVPSPYAAKIRDEFVPRIDIELG